MSSPPGGGRILVVDDEAEFVATYTRLLRRLGYLVLPAGTRHDGLMLVEREPLALVISDVRLPDGNGLDIVRAATTPPRRTPAIVVSGFTSDATRMAAFQAGAAAYLAKPFSASQLLDTVRELAPGKNP